MTIHSRSRRAGHALRRYIDRHRHVLATGIASIAPALQPMTSLELHQFAASRTELSVRTTTLEVTVRLCVARTGCGSVAVHVTPR